MSMTYHDRCKLIAETVRRYRGHPERRCVNSLGTCYYSMHDSENRCAVGHLLSDEAARSDRVAGRMMTVSKLRRELIAFPSDAALLADYGIGFLSKLQKLHDDEDVLEDDEALRTYIISAAREARRMETLCTQ